MAAVLGASPSGVGRAKTVVVVAAQEWSDTLSVESTRAGEGLRWMELRLPGLLEMLGCVGTAAGAVVGT